MNIFKRVKSKAGFSLIEILAVLFVVSMALLGVVSLIVQNVKVQTLNRNNLIASSLAQEGIELIRQTRDSNWRSGGATLYDRNLADGSYIIDYLQDKPVNSIVNTKLYLNSDGFYVHDILGDPTLKLTTFSRQIVITKKMDASLISFLQVRSIVSWVDRNKPRRYELQTLLYDWK
jgi:prepilin-type N-terminal cleavage/methylation domain-containing protein